MEVAEFGHVDLEKSTWAVVLGLFGHVLRPGLGANAGPGHLADGCRSFDEHCARGIEPNRAVIEAHLRDSLMTVTALTPHIGYDRAAEIAKKAHREDTSLREAALALGHVTAEQFDQWVRPERMTRPGP